MRTPGLCQSSGWRVGASRLPSRAPPVRRARSDCAAACHVLTAVSRAVERLLEAVGVRALGLRQRLEPVGDLVEAFVARGLSPCPGTCRCTRASRPRSRPSGCRACGRSAGRSPGRRPCSRYSRWPCAWPVSPSAVERNSAATSVVAFDVGLRCEIEVATIGLRLAGERRLQVVCAVLLPFRIHDVPLLVQYRPPRPGFRQILTPLLTRESKLRGPHPPRRTDRVTRQKQQATPDFEAALAELRGHRRPARARRAPARRVAAPVRAWRRADALCRKP